MKLVNYRCECGNNIEIYYTSDENKSKTTICSCGKEAKEFNIKNNKQVWRFLS